MKRILVPSAALLWGLQFAVLNAALALILVDLRRTHRRYVAVTLARNNRSPQARIMGIWGWSPGERERDAPPARRWQRG